jgi:hypothetical protein
MARRGLYANINARKKAGTSRSKKKSTMLGKKLAQVEVKRNLLFHQKPMLI